MSFTPKSSLIAALVLLSSGAVYGQGLKGEYFANTGLAGKPALTRTENVNFNWGGSSPGDPIGMDNFSVRWTGTLTLPASGSYTFATRSDDGVRLWVGGDPVIDNWTDHSAFTNRSQPVQLVAGEPVSIRLEFYESGGDAVIELYWAGPGIEEQIIPVDYLSPTIMPNLKARKPIPADGALAFDAQMPLLEWTPGDTAIFHDIYLGLSPLLTDADLVASRQALYPALYYHVFPMTPGATYYWRVDEIEKDLVTVHAGNVWSFTVQALTAYHPQPADETTDAPVAPMLTWLPGAEATKHQLYFGDSLDAVAQGVAETNKGELALADASFTPGVLDPVTTYYWRVDETVAAGVVMTGPVWSFTTCLPVDDFESYTDDEGRRIYESWADGPVNGSGSFAGYLNAPFTETTVIHGGLQSMPLDFNNIDAPFYSQVELEFAGAEDWTISGANTLILYLHGRLTNPPAQLYVSVEDSSKHSATVKHPNLEITKTLTWTPWKIPLSDFVGVSSARIKKICIGLGDETNPVQGGAGLLFVDDIGVIKETPVP